MLQHFYFGQFIFYFIFGHKTDLYEDFSSVGLFINAPTVIESSAVCWVCVKVLVWSGPAVMSGFHLTSGLSASPTGSVQTEGESSAGISYSSKTLLWRK